MVEEVVVATLEETLANATHWTRAKMAQRGGLCESTIGRIWKAFNLRSHRTEGCKLSNDSLFMEKMVDVVGLYLNRPEDAVVYCMDEKSQVQALGRFHRAVEFKKFLALMDEQVPEHPQVYVVCDSYSRTST